MFVIPAKAGIQQFYLLNLQQFLKSLIFLAKFKFFENFFSTPQNIEKIILKMAEKNIETRPLWKPMHLQPLFKNAIGEIDGTSEKLFNNGLCLPSGSSLSSDEVDFVAKSLKELIE